MFILTELNCLCFNLPTLTFISWFHAGSSDPLKKVEQTQKNNNPPTTLNTLNALHLPLKLSAAQPRVRGVFACRLEIGQSDATCGQWRQRHPSIRSESPDFFGSSPGTVGTRLRNGDGLPKCKSVLCSPLALATAINQKRPTTISTLLTLHSHPTVDTGSGPNDAERVLLSCQVHLPPTPAGIRPLVWKKKKKVKGN